MADFSIDSYFNRYNSFTKVRFSGDSPVLESELNELQDIQNSLREDLIDALFVNGIEDLSSISTASAGGTSLTVTIANTSVHYNGKLFNIDSIELVVSDGDTLYLEFKMDELETYNSVITRYGNDQSSIETNEMLDARYGSETTKRVQTQYDLVATLGSFGGVGAPYLTIGTNTAGVFTPSIVTFGYSGNPSNFYGVSAVGTDAYAITTAFGYTAYALGMSAVLEADVDNTGASTCNIDSLGVKTLKIYDSTGKVDTVTGNIIAGGVYNLVYDGTDLIILNPTASVVSANGTTSANTSVAAASTYTKTIALGFSATSAIVIMKADGNEGNTVICNDTASDTYSAFVSDDAATNSRVYAGSTRLSDDVYSACYLTSAYIDGTDLKLVFTNPNGSSSETVIFSAQYTAWA